MCSFRDQETTLDTMLRLITISLLFNICFGFKQGRIVGGHSTDITKHPYQVSLEMNGLHNCGGSIISPDWVVTAGHCVAPANTSLIIYNPIILRVRAGSTYREKGGYLHNISKAIVHPYYRDILFMGADIPEYDVAVLKVDTPFLFNDAVKPISMTHVSPSDGDAAVVTGWGVFNYTLRPGYSNKKLPSQLQALDVGIVDQQECKRELLVITDQMVCASAPETFQDACNGDSGGPLVSKGKLVGVVSWGFDLCAMTGRPEVYADVASLRKWIELVTGIA
ncbi:hypothetical protein L9F63_007087 [Diploptera punctata]|uniref:Peptidase S1 domain-containing protein n=1 Tax=Diploptera punctata TaxID=6984 RepID=A0AAD7Z9B7_DIPPU|nr:hypothetical protein L9F63_007087 [Diploptera punctata]